MDRHLTPKRVSQRANREAERPSFQDFRQFDLKKESSPNPKLRVRLLDQKSAISSLPSLRGLLGILDGVHEVAGFRGLSLGLALQNFAEGNVMAV
jgi:hypothetical protein